MSTKTTGLRKRQEISSANRTMLLWIVAASVAVSFLLVASQFLIQRFNYNAKVLGIKNKAVSQLDENLKNIETLKKEFTTLDHGNKNVNSRKVLNALPSELDPSAFGTSIQQAVAPKSGVTLETVSIDRTALNTEGLEPVEGEEPVALTPTPQELRATVAVSGNYDQVANFVKDMELVIRPIKFNKVNLSGSDSNTRATIELTTYYQPKKTVEVKKEVVKE
ncbi:hypothetical protein JNJ66_06300 [Candidatus Saccharibacteria bacterium]|nr:hypothetical protein [Candidatus Saccharibacteria bacterium]